MILATISAARPNVSFRPKQADAISSFAKRGRLAQRRNLSSIFRAAPTNSTVHLRAAQPTTTLKLQIPKIRRRLLQLQPQLPPRSPLVPSPNQHRLTLLLIRQISQRDRIAHRKLRRHNRHAPIRADIHGVPLSPPRLPLILTLHRHFHSRINPHSRPQIRPFGTSHIITLIVSVIQKWHVNLSQGMLARGNRGPADQPLHPP
jgi:hypothetical protein